MVASRTFGDLGRLGGHTMTGGAFIATQTAQPAVCETVISTLPSTGSGMNSLWVFILAVCLVALGAVIVLRIRQHGRPYDSPRHGAPRVLGLLAVGLLASLGLAIPAHEAHAAGTTVTYSEGCSLIEVTEVNVIGGENMFPGDDIPVLEVTVANRFDAPVSLTATLDKTSDPDKAQGIDMSVTAEPVAWAQASTPSNARTSIPPGESVTVVVAAALPLEADDDHQQAAFDVVVHLLATEQPTP